MCRLDAYDSIAVIQCLLFAWENYGSDKITDGDTFLRDTLTFLNERKDSRWISQAWFLKKAAKVFEEITFERTAQVLQNLVYMPEVNYEAEAVLVKLAERYAEAVWDYFGSRLVREAANGENEERFEAVPFQLHELDKELSKNPKLAISKGLLWFGRDRTLFQFRGGRLLSSVFPTCAPEFASALADLVKAGGDSEANFALAIVQNYRGEMSAFSVLKEIVSRFPDDTRKMSEVRAAIDNTGVVTGEFGLAEAWRARRESLKEWLLDERSAVKGFAEKHISELDLMITSEQRRAETEKEMRHRDYDE